MTARFRFHVARLLPLLLGAGLGSQVAAAPLRVDLDGGGGETAAGWLGWDPANPDDSTLDTGVGIFPSMLGVRELVAVRITTAGHTFERNYGIDNVVGVFSAETPAELWSDQYLVNQVEGAPLVLLLGGLKAGSYSLRLFSYFDNLATNAHAGAGTAVCEVWVNGVRSGIDAKAYGGSDSSYTAASLEAQVTSIPIGVPNDNDEVEVELRNPSARHFGLNGFVLEESTTLPPGEVLGRVVISEFLASNAGSLLDGDGGSSDWIEIWNSTEGAINLDGWALTDDPSGLERWPFPALTLLPDQRLLVFASGRQEVDHVDGGGFLHANFRLSKGGGSYLALVGPDGQVVHEYAAYPEQREDISYGLQEGAFVLTEVYFPEPTPGVPNAGPSVLGFVADTRFDHDRGFYAAPFHVVISTATPGAAIRYTLDGSEPTETNGFDYPGGMGVPITTTTTLRAAAFRDGFLPTNVDTQTYLFAEDVVRQPAQPGGFPTTWTGSDYGMEDDPAHLALIAGNRSSTVEEARAVIAGSLQELPALSLVMPVDDWFSPATGIYHNSTSEGAAWERACSAELIHPPGAEGDGDFQIDCGVRVQGFTSRSPTRNPKHSLRLTFRGQYGDAKLRYPFFGDDAPAEFDTIVLRSNSQDGWVDSIGTNRVAQFVRDEWARQTHRAMGHASPDGAWVHLFINGLYWGVYNPVERPDSAHGAAYFGGSKADYDAIKNHEEVLDGTETAYLRLLNMIQNDPRNWSAGYRDLSGPVAYERALQLIDVEMMIDYMIHNMYAAATDWPGNFYMGYDRTRMHGGWKFYDWDNEHGMKHAVGTDRTTPHSRDRDSPTKFHHAMRVNAEYRLLFADRLHRAFFNGGVLAVDPVQPGWDPAHPERNVPAARWVELTSGIERALVAESARWGDYRQAVPYTVHDEFQEVRDDLLQNWFPRRSAIVLEQFRAQGLYPDVAAPQFNRFGGVVPDGFELEVSAPGGGEIYYTLDGSDPREMAERYTGPIGLSSSGTVKARVFEGGEWSALVEADFLVGSPAGPGTLVVSEIMYHPTGGSSHEFIELLNISSGEAIELAGTRFTAGISFSFPAGSRLEPGERLLLVEDRSAFEAHYGDGHPVAGQYAGELDDSGELLVLEAHDGAVIASIRYDDEHPWPTSPDGQGSSLVLIAPERGPDPGDPLNWRASVAAGGSPGGSDHSTFVGDPDEDRDRDGMVALLEYALGTSEMIPDRTILPSVAIREFPDGQGGVAEFVTITFRQNLAAEDLTFNIESSDNLVDWKSAAGEFVLVAREDLGSGLAQVTHRAAMARGPEMRRFHRLRVSLR